MLLKCGNDIDICLFLIMICNFTYWTTVPSSSKATYRFAHSFVTCTSVLQLHCNSVHLKHGFNIKSRMVLTLSCVSTAFEKSWKGAGIRKLV